MTIDEKFEALNCIFLDNVGTVVSFNCYSDEVEYMILKFDGEIEPFTKREFQGETRKLLESFETKLGY